MKGNNSNDTVLCGDKDSGEVQCFADALCSMLQEKLGEGYRIGYEERIGFNGTRTRGVLIICKGMNAGGYIHLQQWEGWNQDGCSVEECANRILQEHEQQVRNLPVAKEEAEKIASWDNAKDRVLPFLISYEGNEEYLAPLVHERKLDLAVGCYINVEQLDGKTYIRKDLAEKWGIPEKELMGQAMVNLGKEDYSVLGIEKVIEEITGIPWDRKDPIPMMVMTNRDRRMGAAGILKEGLLKECSDKVNDSLYLLPSSIHEMMVVPAGSFGDPEELQEIVYEINREQVAQEERLSDHVYLYDRDKGEISIAA